MPPSKRRNKGKQESARIAAEAAAAAAAVASSKANQPQNESTAAAPPSPSKDTAATSSSSLLVLTSGKRRGVYECDYCHADISQVPRIRCASCADFDLCLDCFATTDHSAAIARLKALGQAHADAVSTSKSGVSAAAANHDVSHSYRVADSTRYPLFPSSAAQQRVVASVSSSRPSSVAASTDDMEDIEEEEDNENDTDFKEEEEVGMDVDSESNNDASKTGSQAEEPEPMEEETKKEEPEEKEKEAGEKHAEEMKEKSKEETEEKAEKEEPEEKAKEETDEKAADETKAERDVVKATQSEDQPPKDKTVLDNKMEKLESSDVLIVPEDPKSMWTVEEDLRLLDAIETCGMGNWADIAEAISGNGSANKTPKRCMERYFDDFLGRYGHVLPSYTYEEEEESDAEETNNNDTVDDTKSDTDFGRSTKRRRTERNMFRSQSLMSMSSFRNNKKKSKVVPTSSLPGYDQVWPNPYIPPIPNVEIGQEVGRDQSMRAENAYVKVIASAPNKAERDTIRREWMQHRLNQINGPTVLPSHPHDISEMPGAELAGYMPRRGDFDMEWDNDAENILADMEFSPNDFPQDRQLKIQVIEIYNAKLDERERRKEFLLSRNLMDYRKNQQADMALPRDERDLVRRMRLFERHHTPEEHKQFIADLLKAKRLRKEIAKLQMYRRMGIRTLAEAEKYDLDKARREFHKGAQLQKEQEAEKAKAAAMKAAAAKESAGAVSSGVTGYDSATTSSSLWKQYKTKGRRSSMNRSTSAVSTESAASSNNNSQNVRTASAKDDNDDNKQTGTGHNKSERQVDAKVAASESPEQEPKDREDSKEDSDSKRPADTDKFNIVNTRGYELLSSKEVTLCEKLHLLPVHYLEIKKALISESLNHGLLEGSRKNVVKIDAEKRGDVVNFMVRAGWISTKVGIKSE